MNILINILECSFKFKFMKNIYLEERYLVLDELTQAVSIFV